MNSLTGDPVQDHNFIRLPYEYQVKQFKIQRKQVEKQLTEILKQIIDAKNQTIDQNEALNMIEYLIAQLRCLKERVNINYKELQDTLTIIKKRLSYLQSFEQQALKENEITCLHEQQLLRAIIDMLLRMGYFKTANQMIQMSKLEDFMSLEQQIITEAFLIIQDLEQHSAIEALKWCAANRTRLIKVFWSSFEFQLVFQTYIEFLKRNQIREALAYMQKQISYIKMNPTYNEYVQKVSPPPLTIHINKAMGCLLLIKQINKFPTYQVYFEEERWQELIRKFKIEMQNMYSLQVNPPLQTLLQAGLTTLKSINCSIKEQQRPQVCPACNKMMEKMVINLPQTCKLESTWICRITGEIMDANNPPMVLPNNQVYSQKALLIMAHKSNGKVICPITKEEYNVQDAIRVFLS